MVTITKKARRYGACTKRAVRKAIEGSRGIVREIADRLGVDRCTLYNGAFKKWPSLKKLLREERDKLVDTGERELWYLLEQRKNLVAKAGVVKWILTTRGAKRGYGDPVKKVQLSGGDTPIKVLSTNTIDFSKLNLPLKVRRQILAAIEAASTAEGE